MNSNDPSMGKVGSDESDGLPLYGGEVGVRYTLEMVAELAGVDAGTVLHYRSQGFIRPVRCGGSDGEEFDEECLRQLRRIEHLRSMCAVNETGLRLLLALLDEVEILREERRSASR
jgi:DNA-binding transcriptional MerR regulator